MKHTKIVATISDQRCDIDFMKRLYDAGMNVVRMNTAHLTEEGLHKIISNTRAVSKKIAILMDTKGPEIRTTKIADGNDLKISTGDRIKIVGNPEVLTTKDCIGVSYPFIVRDVDVQCDLLLDDGEIDLKVIDKTDDFLLCEAQNDGVLGSRKSVNVPGVRINLPSLTEKDKVNIALAIKYDVDFIAHSFVRSKQDVLDIQQLLDKQNSAIKIIAKIENQEGVDKIDEILDVAYGIMIARGDLGIEIPQEKIPGIQRLLIRKCVAARRPVIVATQMLHSMIKNPRPTRAEVTDVANAIYYRTDAIMLSGETAYGKYPEEAVLTMAKIAQEAEKTKIPDNDIKIPFINNPNGPDITSFLAMEAAEAAKTIGTKAIITDSYTGRTARHLAAYRSTNPVLAICYNERVMRELALSYGIFPSYQAELSTTREYLFKALQYLLNKELISKTDYVSFLSGSYGPGCGSTFIEINCVGKIMDTQEGYSLPSF